MKTKLIVLFSVAVAALIAQSLTQPERDFALSALHASHKALLDSVTALTPAQWNFKPAPDRWSIAQIAEHLALSEDELNAAIQNALRTPAVAPRPADRAQDEALLKGVTDRTQKRQAAPELQPKGQYATSAAFAVEFKRRRERTLEFVRTTQAPLRVHVTGAGAVDAYQLLLLFAGHTDRHIAQIHEVQADPAYPR